MGWLTRVAASLTGWGQLARPHHAGERPHGPDHYTVAADAAALAGLLEGLGEDAEAESLYRRALVIFNAAGDDHEAAMTRNGLGSTCQALDRFDEGLRRTTRLQ